MFNPICRGVGGVHNSPLCCRGSWPYTPESRSSPRWCRPSSCWCWRSRAESLCQFVYTKCLLLCSVVHIQNLKIIHFITISLIITIWCKKTRQLVKDYTRLIISYNKMWPSFQYQAALKTVKMHKIMYIGPLTPTFATKSLSLSLLDSEIVAFLCTILFHWNILLRNWFKNTIPLWTCNNG